MKPGSVSWTNIPFNVGAMESILCPNFKWCRRDSNPQCREAADLQSAGLPISSYCTAKAGPLGIELRAAGLEAAVLPLHHGPVH